MNKRNIKSPGNFETPEERDEYIIHASTVSKKGSKAISIEAGVSTATVRRILYVHKNGEGAEYDNKREQPTPTLNFKEHWPAPPGISSNLVGNLYR